MNWTLPYPSESSPTLRTLPYPSDPPSLPHCPFELFLVPLNSLLSLWTLSSSFELATVSLNPPLLLWTHSCPFEPSSVPLNPPLLLWTLPLFLWTLHCPFYPLPLLFLSFWIGRVPFVTERTLNLLRLNPWGELEVGECDLGIAMLHGVAWLLILNLESKSRWFLNENTLMVRRVWNM